MSTPENAVDMGRKAALARFTPTESEIAALRAKYEPLEIRGIEDTKGLRVVDDARKDVKRHRCAIDNVRKELIADALTWQKTVNAEAKRLTAPLIELEEGLAMKVEAVQDEKARLAEEERIRVAQVLRLRMDQLDAVRSHRPSMIVEKMSDEEFATALDEDTAVYRKLRAEEAAEREREERERAAAAEKLRKDREELDRLRAEDEERRRAQAAADAAEREKREAEEAERRKGQEAEAAKLREERERLEADRRRMDREQAERERTEREAREKSEREERERRDAEAHAAREKALAEARVRAERAARPDQEKVLEFADVIEALEVPDVRCAELLRDVLRATAAQLRDVATGVLEEAIEVEIGLCHAQEFSVQELAPLGEDEA